MNLRQNGKVFTSKFVGTGPSSYEKRIYPAAVSQRLRNTVLDEQRAAFVEATWAGVMHLYPPLRPRPVFSG